MDHSSDRHSEGPTGEPAEAAKSPAHNSPCLVIGVDSDSVVRYLNPAAEAGFGWLSTEARGRPLELLLPVGPIILSELATGDRDEQLAAPLAIRAQTQAGEPLLVNLADIVDQVPRLLVFEPC